MEPTPNKQTNINCERCSKGAYFLAGVCDTEGPLCSDCYHKFSGVDGDPVVPNICCIALDETHQLDLEWVRGVFTNHGVDFEKLVRFETLYFFDRNRPRVKKDGLQHYRLRAYDSRFIFVPGFEPWSEEIQVVTLEHPVYPSNFLDVLEQHKPSWENRTPEVMVPKFIIDRLAEQYAKEDFRWDEIGEDKASWDWMLEQRCNANFGDTDGNCKPTGSHEAFMEAMWEGLRSNSKI